MEMVLVLTHLTGSEELDRQRAEEYCRYAAHKGKIPVSPFLCFHGIFKDELGSAVEGILVSRLMEKADGIWVFGFERGDREGAAGVRHVLRGTDRTIGRYGGIVRWKVNC